MGKKKKHKRGDEPGVRTICTNKRARHDYQIEDRLEAGLVLRGSEVKSLRCGRASLNDAYALIEDGEAFLVNSHIPEYPWANRENHPPGRRRKLLLHAREIHKLEIKTNQRGYTLVPLRFYFRDARVKVELGLARGKRSYDKRESLKRRDQAREMEKQLRYRQ